MGGKGGKPEPHSKANYLGCYIMSVVYIKEEIDFGLAAERLRKIFPDFSVDQIESAFKRYFWGREDAQDWVYSEQLDKAIESLLVDFIAEQQNENRIAARTALELNMPIYKGKSSTIYKAGAWL